MTSSASTVGKYLKRYPLMVDSYLLKNSDQRGDCGSSPRTFRSDTDVAGTAIESAFAFCFIICAADAVMTSHSENVVFSLHSSHAEKIGKRHLLRLDIISSCGCGPLVERHLQKQTPALPRTWQGLIEPEPMYISCTPTPARWAD